MSPIITQPGAPAHVHPDEAARKLHDRLARATAEQVEAALAYLSVIDPLMFEIAMDAADQIVGVAPQDEAAAENEPVPVCRRCGGQAGIFLEHGLDWQHFRGDGTTAGAQEVYDPGHPVEVTCACPARTRQRHSRKSSPVPRRPAPGPAGHRGTACLRWLAPARRRS